MQAPGAAHWAGHGRTRARHSEPPDLGHPHHLPDDPDGGADHRPVSASSSALISGYCGGKVDTVLMRFTDIVLSFPSLVLALSFAAALGAGLGTAIIAISLTSWPSIARLARAETLTVRRAEYVAAARLYGASHLRLIFLYIMPMCIPSVIVRLTLAMASVILTAAGLGFLGLGAQPPSPEWGAMNFLRAQVHARRLVDRRHARHRHPERQPGLQPARRHLARHSGSAPCPLTLRPPPPTRCCTFAASTSPSAATPTRFFAVKGATFDLGRERLGIVGESGSGSIHPRPGDHAAASEERPVVTAEAMRFMGTELMSLGRGGHEPASEVRTSA